MFLEGLATLRELCGNHRQPSENIDLGLAPHVIVTGDRYVSWVRSLRMVADGAGGR